MARIADVNGLPGLTLTRPDGTLYAAIGLDHAHDGINGIFAVLNPDKLVRFSALRAPTRRDPGRPLP